MIRFLLRRLPRFGFLTLFAAMLLFVSGAGWVKFHFDLYEEEERLLADLAKAGCTVEIGRFGDMPRSNPPREPPWYQLPEPLRRVRVLWIYYPRQEDRPLVERAATLPLVDEFGARFDPSNMTAPPPATPYPDATSYFAGMTLELPRLPDTPIPDLEQPLPEGEPLPEDETLATVEAWRAAWSNPIQFPRTGAVRSSSKAANETVFREAIQIRGRDGHLEAFEHGLSLGSPMKLSAVMFESSELRETGRQLDAEAIRSCVGDSELYWLQATTSRKILDVALWDIPSPFQLHSFEKDLDPSAIESIQRTAGGCLRIDFHPTKKSFPGEGIEDEARLSVLVRPDRDFAVEAYDIRVERTDAASPDPIVWTPRFRGVSSDHDGAYLLDAFSHETLRATVRWATTAPIYYSQGGSGRHAYDFEQEPSDELFTPATYGAIELPPPRPLPVWRWYRVTFFLGLGLFAYAIFRWALARRRRDVNLPAAKESGVAAESI